MTHKERRALSESDIATARAMKDRGANLRDIAAHFGCGIATVYRALSGKYVDPRAKQPRGKSRTQTKCGVVRTVGVDHEDYRLASIVDAACKVWLAQHEPKQIGWNDQPFGRRK